MKSCQRLYCSRGSKVGRSSLPQLHVFILPKNKFESYFLSAEVDPIAGHLNILHVVLGWKNSWK